MQEPLMQADSKILFCESFLKYTKFCIFGMGPSWVFASLVFQEIPYFQRYQPEGFCISAFMNASVNFGSVLSVVYALVLQRCNCTISTSIFFPFLLSVPFFGTIFAAFLHSYCVGGLSLFIFLSCFLGGCVGSLSSLFLNPFMSAFESNLISSYRAGNSIGILIVSLTSLIQSPGSNQTRFSPTIYFMIFAIILAFPIIFYKQIINDYQHHTNYMVTNHIPPKDYNPSLQDIPPCDESPQCTPSDSETDVETDDITTPLHRKNHILFTVIKNQSESGQIIFNSTVLRLMVIIGWTNFNAWGILPAAVPFVTNIATAGVNSSFYLNIAYSLGGFLMVFGDLSTMFFRLPLNFSVATFTLCALSIYAINFNLCHSFQVFLPPMVILLYSAGRFFESHMITSAYRAIASSSLSAADKQAATRAVSYSDQFCTILGVVFSTILVKSTVTC